MFPTIQENFTILLRAGAFGITDEPLKPMSSFKWNKLINTAKKLGICGYIVSGAHLLKDDPLLPSNINEPIEEEKFTYPETALYGFLSSRRYKKISEQEKHNIDCSTDTLEFLHLLVANIDLIITKDISIPGIIAVGKYLRTKGNRVDFVKLNEWISKLGIAQVSSFIGHVLIELFDFESEELEFMTRTYKKPLYHYDRLLDNAFNPQHKFKRASKLNLAFIETSSYHLLNFKTRITDIEE